jgi:PIN domain nuclease of toxin-antitoxin system
MRLLLDTHVVIAICKDELLRKFPKLVEILAASDTEAVVSVASLWEIAIKTRLGKLDPEIPLERLPELLEAYSFEILDITRRHALAYVMPDPATKDPFDRMLLMQCRMEGMQLVTIDHALAEHPFAWRPEGH